MLSIRTKQVDRFYIFVFFSYLLGKRSKFLNRFLFIKKIAFGNDLMQFLQWYPVYTFLYHKKIAFGDDFLRFSQWYPVYTFLYHKKVGPGQRKEYLPHVLLPPEFHCFFGALLGGKTRPVIVLHL